MQNTLTDKSYAKENEISRICQHILRISAISGCPHNQL